MVRARIVLVTGILAAAISASWAAGGPERSSGAERSSVPLKPIAVVSILPQEYFVDRISGGRWTAMALVGEGQSPHSYEPTPRQMANLSSAQLWLTIGAEFEKTLKPKVAALYPGLSIVDATVGIKYRRLEAHDHEVDADEPDDHDESGLDTHVWLGRQAVKSMAAVIRDSLSKADPAGASAYAAGHDALIRDVDAAYERLGKRLAPLAGKPVFVYHPAFGYLLDEFGIEQEAVETGGKEPTQRTLAALVAEARADGAKVIFVQAQFPAAAAKTVADAIGGAVVSIDPLARDWLDNLYRLGAALEKAIR